MATPDPDAKEARISAACPGPTREILEAAWQHDVPALKRLLDVPGKASSRDPTTGETALHAAVRAAEPVPGAAEAAVRELLFSGAIWNDVDDCNETPGCVALRLGRRELYALCVDAGVRAELLFALLDGYEALSSGPEEADDDHDGDDGAGGEAEGEEVVPRLVEVKNGDAAGSEEIVAAAAAVDDDDDEPRFVAPKADTEAEVKSETYLRSKLTYSEGKLVDDDGNGVMMAWETDIMRQSVDALLPGREAGKRILNIGFGMGIIDSMFAETKSSRHHIIEAHPEVLDRILAPNSKALSFWGPDADPDAFQVHQGKWQDICPKLLESGEVYDAVYFDTFGEDYSQLRLFFTEYIPGLLDQNGIFGFFNGLGADRRICYDVYTRVVEMHLADAGLDVDWKAIPVDMEGLGEDGKGEWAGVKRRYWTLDGECHSDGGLSYCT